jgi:multidrug efflux pump
MNLTETSVRKPVLAWMIMGATVVFGGVAATRIGISQFPDVDFPTISVAINWEGAAPEVVENDVIEPLEEALSQVEGIQSLTSVSRRGGGSITIELDLKRSVDVALQDVQARVAQTQQRLPRDIDPPIISKTNPEDQPIMWVGLSGPFSPQVLADFARYRLKERLQTVPGVGEITMGGYRERNVRLWVDAARLDERNITVHDVLEALRREHVELPAGQLTTTGREINVRVLGEALDLGAFRRIVLRHEAGATVRLEDVALVEDGFEDERRRARVGGAPAQGLGIKKQRGANAVAVAREVRSALAEMRKTLPAGMDLGINFDSTGYIEEAVAHVERDVYLSIALTAFVCWLFLGSLSSTLNVVLAIPMSLLGTIAVIYFLGFTLNTFTLLALALAVGIVVDDAIMVMENVFRHGEAGKDRRRAALEGTREIQFAALAATLAVCAIFIPVVFMKGVIGKFFLQFGIALSLCVLLSYLEAVTLAPARLSQMLATSREGRGRVGRAADRVFDRLARGYGRLLDVALRHPGLVLLSAAAIFGGSLFVFRALPGEFVPSQDQSRLMVRLQTAVGADLEETDLAFKKAETFVNARPEVDRAFTIIGGFGGTGVNTGILFLTMVPKTQRALSQTEFAALLRKELNGYPGVRAIVQDLSQSGFTAQRGFPVEFSVRGGDWDTLVTTTQAMMRRLQESGAMVDVDSDYQLGMPELRVVPDRDRAADLGVSMEEVAETIQALVGGVRVGKYNDAGRRIDVRLRLLAGQRTRPEDLARLRVHGRGDEMVPLSGLVAYDEQPALQAVTRRDRERAITVFANVAPGHSQQEAVQLVEKLSRDLPAGTHAVLGGASATFRESMTSLLFALALGIIVAYMILGAQFNSFLHPVTVLTILPLSVAGAAFALLIMGKSMNIFSMIGLLLLMGIVKKNSIILVDYANQLRDTAGLGAREAMRRAGPIRLRPILMTSISTMMAAVPSALAMGAGGEVRAPMSIAVIGGLVVSTALSLLVVPSFYVAADRLVARLVPSRRRAAVPAE